MTPGHGRPRLVPEIPFPRYTYVPGGNVPHPRRDRTGHSFGLEHRPGSAPDPSHWQSSRDYLYGLDLFNHGYYWEAHEVWEALWLACGRQGISADFLKALIKLAAAGVKLREGISEGARSHAHRAYKLLDSIAQCLASAQPRYMGLDLAALLDLASHIEEQPIAGADHVAGLAIPVFEVMLWPG